jgi:hypothetical protein
MSLERGNEALGVEQWRGRQNSKEEEERVFIPTPPELDVGLRPGRVIRLLTEPTRVARPLVLVDPVGLQGVGRSSLRLERIFLNVFLGFSLLEKMREDHKRHLWQTLTNRLHPSL